MSKFPTPGVSEGFGAAFLWICIWNSKSLNASCSHKTKSEQIHCLAFKNTLLTTFIILLRERFIHKLCNVFSICHVSGISHFHLKRSANRSDLGGKQPPSINNKQD